MDEEKEVKCQPECRAPGPYPPVKVVRKNLYYAKLLLDDYASDRSELTAITQYIYHHITLAPVNEEASDLMECIAVVEMDHLHMLGEAILLLSGDPEFRGFLNNNNQWWSGQYVYYGAGLYDRLVADLAGERGAVEQYERHKDFIADPYIKALLERIIQDEKLHIELLKHILKGDD